VKGFKIFTACALGAFIGSLIAFQFAPFFWWLGLIAGFVGGYLSYEFNEVVRVAKTAWVKRRQVWESTLLVLVVTMITLSAIITVVSLLGSWFGLFVVLFSEKADFNIKFFVANCIASIIGYFLACFSVWFLNKKYIWEEENEQLSYFEVLKYFWHNPESLVIKLNPILLTAYFLPKGVLSLVPRISRIAVGIYRFAKEIFVEIHSDIRLLCGVDAAIGAGVGYFAGNPLIGALAGGLFGVLNYYLISIKLLKLVPKN
jgi:preprotein translocase subunit SecE